MAYLNAFEHFNPLTGAIPSGLTALFQESVDRARIILKRRSIKEIVYGLESLDWMLQKGSELFRPTVIRGVDPDKRERYYSSDAKGLCLYLDYFEIKGQPSFPDATWPEYFAILALSFAGEAINVSRSPITDSHLPMGQGQIQKAGWISDLAIDAVDAVDLAESFQAELTRFGDNAMAAATNKVRVERVAQYDELKRKVISTYEEINKDGCNRDNSKKIWQELTKEARSILATPDPQRRFQLWIDQYIRSKG